MKKGYLLLGLLGADITIAPTSITLMGEIQYDSGD